MQLKGKIIAALPKQSGTSQTGKPWRKREYVLETQERYPKKIAFVVMNEGIDQFNIQAGAGYTIDVDAESREYNGKWYTTITAWKSTPGIGDFDDTFTDICKSAVKVEENIQTKYPHKQISGGVRCETRPSFSKKSLGG